MGLTFWWRVPTLNLHFLCMKHLLGLLWFMPMSSNSVSCKSHSSSASCVEHRSKLLILSRLHFVSETALGISAHYSRSQPLGRNFLDLILTRHVIWCQIWCQTSPSVWCGRPEMTRINRTIFSKHCFLVITRKLVWGLDKKLKISPDFDLNKRLFCDVDIATCELFFLLQRDRRRVMSWSHKNKAW